jgi:hypothetical protein
MIRYQISPAVIEALIEKLIPGWLARASERTGRLASAGHYSEASSIWSEVKAVYMTIQYSKCAYCERGLEGPEYGRIEHDLEHYRPKSRVRPWPTEQMRRMPRFQYGFSTGSEMPKGYFWLAYDILNYATACKSCNSSLKRDYFPIAGNRAPNLADRQALAAELPLLIYPISDIDDDPESILTFEGIVPISADDDDFKRKRAQVTIDFFRLDSREHLRRERARQITAAYMALRVRDFQGFQQEERDLAVQVLAGATAPNAPHSNCTKAFLNTYRQDPDMARVIAQLASDYLTKLPK